MSLTNQPGRRLKRAAALASTALLAAVLAACSSTSKTQPSPLEPLTPRLMVKKAWEVSTGSTLPGLRVANLPDRLLLAAENGTVLALDPATGAERGRWQAGEKLSAGVGSDGRFVAVVTRDNELVVFDGAKPRWRKTLGARVVTAPLVAGERVFVQGTDRVTEAYDALDGLKLWSFSRSGDPLALAESGLLMAFKDTLLVGQGPKLVALEPLLGGVRGEVAMATPRGTNEVERLADLVGPAARVGDVVCARAFQSAVSCTQAERGALLWSRNVGGYQGVAADATQVYAADATDRMSAWRLNNGDVAWTSERLRFRGLSAPVVSGDAVVYGDSEGYVHWLSQDKGELLQRMKTDSSGVATLVARPQGKLLIAITHSGGVYAFRSE